MHVALVVYSGTGNTDYLAHLISHALRGAGHSVCQVPIKRMVSGRRIPPCDMIGFGSPVYHAEPPGRVLKALEALEGHGLPLFTFWTMGLYAGDCAHLFHSRALVRGFRPVANFEATFPGVDFVAQLRDGSVMNRFFNLRIARGLQGRVLAFCESLSPTMELRVEPPRWYTPLNDIPRRWAIPIYERYKRELRVIPELCTEGRWCVDHCPEEAIRVSEGRIEMLADRCSLCLRCYHGCPPGAIRFGEGRRGRYSGPSSARRFLPVSGYVPTVPLCDATG